MPPPCIRRTPSCLENVRICLGESAAGDRVHLRLCGLVPEDEHGAALRGQVRRGRLDKAGGYVYPFREEHDVILRWRDRVFRLHVWAGTRMWDQMARSNPEVRFCPCWCCWERGEPRKPTPKYPVRAPNPNSAKARLFRRALGRPEFVDPDPKRARTSVSGGKDG